MNEGEELSSNSQEDFINEEIRTTNGDNVLTIKNSVADNLRKILEIWLYRAKETMYLKSLIKEILVRKKEECCKKCGIDVEINVNNE